MTGIDVSKHQGVINWSKVKTDFAILRAGFGRYAYQKDPQFERNYAGAKAAGIPVGAYWYSYARSAEEAREEAKACLQVLKGKQFEFPIYFDIEDSTQGNLGTAVLTAMCEAFCDTLEKAGYFAGVYASTYWFTNKLDHARLASKYTIWLADYRAGYNKTLKRDMHQYTSKGHVDGIAGRVDMNTCNRDFHSIIKKAGLNGYANDESAETDQKSSPERMQVIKIGPVTNGDAAKIRSLCDSLDITNMGLYSAEYVE